jgi:ketosteroid isomerase-like protein
LIAGEFYHSTDLFINVDRVIADGNEVRSIGKWSSDIKEPGRLPEHVGGRYSMLWVHDGDTWKIHENTYDDSGPD